MTRLIVALVALIMLIAVGSVAITAAPLRGDAAEIVIPAGVYRSEDGVVLYIGVTPEHNETETALTPAATETPLYGTYAPTYTPAPTLTPSATYTPMITPTPEVTLTPQPTSTPAPTSVPPSCYAGTQYNLNVREGHTKDAQIVGHLQQGDRVVIVALWLESGAEEWGQLESGNWIALMYDGAALAWLDDTAECWDLPLSGPANPRLVVGIRTVPGASGFEAMYPILQSKGLGYGVSPYASLDFCVAALQASGTCVARTAAPDCPNCTLNDDPRACARDFLQHSAATATILAGSEHAYVETLNECFGTPMDARGLGWWQQFLDETIEQYAARGWPPLALPGLPPGHGDAAMFRAWKPTIEKLRDNGGLWSEHAYTFNSLADLCPFDEWESYRHVHNHGLMLAEGYEIPITITEAAKHAGNAPVDVDDFVCFIEANRGYTWLHSIWLWVGGYHPVWSAANLDGHYEQIANGLQ